MLLRDGWRLPRGENDAGGAILVATEAQLYTVLEDRTAVDKAVNALARRGAIVRLRLASLMDDYALVRSADVVRLLAAAAPRARRATTSDAARGEAAARAMRVFAMEVLRRCRGQVDIRGPALLEIFTTAERPGMSRETAHECIALLLNAGFLRRGAASSDDNTFFFSLPGIGRLVSSIIKVRAAVLAAIKRRRYPEILERDLRRMKTLRGSDVALDFVLRDMKGGGHIVGLTTASGTLLRLGRIR